jgi:hypothetical protein
MKYLALITLLVIFSSLYTNAQGTAGSNAAYETQFIVDMPTAGIIPKSTFRATTIMASPGNMNIFFEASPFENFALGLSFGGNNIIGSGDVDWQKLPGIFIKYRIVDETLSVPAVALGVITQGRGRYYSEFDRSHVYSPGIFAVASKSFTWWLGNVALHGGLCYSFEPKPELRNINFYLGFEQTLGKSVSINLELNPTMEDGAEQVLDKKGMLNMGLKLSLVEGLTLELQGRDLFSHTKESNGFSRAICIEFISSF